MPIIRQDGSFSIDPVPRRLDEPGTLSIIRGFAELIAMEIDALDALARSQNALRREQETARLREEFLAVLGHDLRNPLAAMAAGARLLERDPCGDRARETVALMQASVRRMSGLVDNLLDLAQGRLGGGIPAEIAPCETLRETFEQVATSETEIRFSYEVDGPVACDRRRLAQLLSNLAANALSHGTPGAPVTVEVKRKDGDLRLIVANHGDPIPLDAVGSLFQPYFRRRQRRGGEGVGLGLYIASQIAEAHGGALSVDSSDGTTRFTMTMPLG